MDNLLRKVQLEEYKILNELDKVAKKHNIKYFLGQGTLLGAAKYKKFIPWDDDIDLLIPYRHLLKLAKAFPAEADEKYLLTNCFVEKHFPVAWSKIRNKNTLSRPVLYKDLPIIWGICIDLFPIYSVSNIGFVRKLECLLYKIANKMLLAEMTKYETGHGALVRILEKVPICIRHLYFKAVRGILNLHGDNTKYVMVACKEVKLIERNMIFGEEQFLEFEDGVFPAVSKYDEYLTVNYGDWRADLPADQQKGHELLMGDIEWRLSEEQSEEESFVRTV